MLGYCGVYFRLLERSRSEVVDAREFGLSQMRRVHIYSCSRATSLGDSKSQDPCPFISHCGCAFARVITTLRVDNVEGSFERQMCVSQLLTPFVVLTIHGLIHPAACIAGLVFDVYDPLPAMPAASPR
ncbi:hypothetical protein BDM02DRAFT_2008909 [Thelephora ganbajun]|uniref:Uncharacterized protein n=1 Tax=Thelephora ganbajun TaxID=370292 RepID=A0ACB6Z0E9_THEGA|nr:hypothetical protein BDM02DRAFT_2008909 [Thelephora ganbajun]